MTLIVAGYSMQKLVGFHEDSSEDDGGDIYVDGLVVSSDTSITDGNTILVSGFKKVIDVQVKVKAIDFLGDEFSRYYGTWFESSCFIAFAGSTLVAQHMINSIKNHLGEIYPSFYQNEFCLAMSCEKKKLLKQSDRVDEDMFVSDDIAPLLTAEYIASVVKHSIEAILKRANKHEGMRRNFNAFNVEFILGVQCPYRQTFHLYKLNVESDVAIGAKVVVRSLSTDEVAVIGMCDFYEDDARACLHHTLTNCEDVGSNLHDFVVKAIEDKNNIGDFKIGKPCVLYKYMGGVLERKRFTDID